MGLRGEAASVIDGRSSTSTPLTGGATFTSSGLISTENLVGIVAAVLTDQAGTLYIDGSPDGSNWDWSTSLSVTASTQATLRALPPYANARVRYVNGGVAQTSMRLQTTLRLADGVDATNAAGVATSANQTNGSQIAKLPAATAATSAALAASQVIKASAGTFFSVACEIDPTAPTATYYALVIDAAAAPGDGAVTGLIAAVGVDHTSGTRDSFTVTADQGGVTLVHGCVVCLSTTRPNKTAAGAYLWCNGSVA